MPLLKCAPMGEGFIIADQAPGLMDFVSYPKY